MSAEFPLHESTEEADGAIENNIENEHAIFLRAAGLLDENKEMTATSAVKIAFEQMGLDATHHPQVFYSLVQQIFSLKQKDKAPPINSLDAFSRWEAENE